MSANFPNLPAAIDAWIGRTGHSKAELARTLGISKATVTRWTQGEEPEVKRLKEIAETLGVTVGYLADEEDIAHNDEERQLLQKYRRADHRARKAMRAIADLSGNPEDQPS